jgi:hypothetical protein
MKNSIHRTRTLWTPGIPGGNKPPSQPKDKPFRWKPSKHAKGRAINDVHYLQEQHKNDKANRVKEVKE